MIGISGCLILPLVDEKFMSGTDVKEYNFLNECWNDIAERISYGIDYIYVDDEYDDDDDFKEYIGDWVLHNRPDIDHIENEGVEDRCYVDVVYWLDADIKAIYKLYNYDKAKEN